MKKVTPNIPEVEVRIVKVDSCATVSGKSTLTYHIGCTEDGAIVLRIHANTAAGFFSQEWLPLKAIDEVLMKAGTHFTSFALQPLFRGKSQNNSAFLLAILKHEGLVIRSTEKKRCYQLGDASRFVTEITALINAKVALKVASKPLMATSNKASGSKVKQSKEALAEA